MIGKLFYSGLIFIVVTGCASTTEEGAVNADRRQLLLVPNSQVLTASAQAYEQTKVEARKKGTLDRDSDQLRRLQTISKNLIPHTAVFRKDAPAWSWEVHVIAEPTLNAYCMPGGKIMFYSGIIEKLNLTDGEVAAIMGHEIAHALREHGRERMSQALVQQGLLGVLVATGKVNERYAGPIALAANLAVALPHSRGQESEADDVGLELMARAGYDPREAANLWRKMAAQSQGKPPEFLSTHPGDATRVRRIESWLPRVTPLYEAAKSSARPGR